MKAMTGGQNQLGAGASTERRPQRFLDRFAAAGGPHDLLQTLAARLGGRSYRATLLEAGLVAGRLALNAVALNHGATGLTFYDGLVRRYFRTDSSPLLATAVGIPDTKPAPSGLPGAPVELRRYPEVMARLASRFRGG